MNGDFRIGSWLVRPSLNTVSDNGTSVRLEPKVMQVLVCLAEHAGEAVAKEDLLQKVWPDTFVSDDVIKRSVSELRRIFQDDPHEARVIQTISKRGYRLVIQVEAAQISERAPRWFRRPAPNLGKVLAVLLAATLLVAVWLFMGSSGRVESRVEEVPLTGLAGVELTPAFSPDGNQVAFARYADGGEKAGIYTTLIGGEQPLQLTTNSEDCCPTWSPDGRYVAFARVSDTEFAIYVVPALGGTERRLYARPRSNSQPDDGLSWSPDGKLLAFSEWTAPERRQITLFSNADSKTRALVSPPIGYLDRGPAFSPDGDKVAFIRSVGQTSGPAGDLFVVPTAGGEAKRLTFDNRFLWGPPAWTSDGREIVFSSARAGLATLWRISASGGTPTQVAGAGPISLHPSIPLHGHRLAYVRRVSNQNIWQLKLHDERRVQPPAKRLISSVGANALPRFSPDGTKIAFESERSGYDEVWVCNTDGSNPRPITSLRGYSGSPRWAPDSRFLTFDHRGKGYGQIYVADVTGGTARPLSIFPDADNVVPSWSQDGKSIYFASRRVGRAFQIWKVPATGGVPVQVTKQGGYAPVESDGFLYYSRGLDQPAIWKLPLTGDEETLVLDSPGLSSYNHWEVTRNGIYFIDSRTHQKATIMFFDFTTKNIMPIWTMEKPPWAGMAVSPDGRTLIYPQNDQDEYNITVLRSIF